MPVTVFHTCLSAACHRCLPTTALAPLCHTYLPRRAPRHARAAHYARQPTLRLACSSTDLLPGTIPPTCPLFWPAQHTAAPLSHKPPHTYPHYRFLLVVLPADGCRHSTLQPSFVGTASSPLPTGAATSGHTQHLAHVSSKHLTHTFAWALKDWRAQHTFRRRRR